MHGRPVYSLAIVFGLTAAILLILLSGSTPLLIGVGSKTRIINIGIIVDVDSHETALVRDFVKSLPHTNNLYFVIEEWDSLKDEDFVQFMKDRGEIIPALSYLQTYEPEDRERYADHFLGEFKRLIGSYPKGIFTFQPDTYTANYLRDKYNISFVIGYAFDQYLVDYMSMRGGWQAPYYGSRQNVIVPSQTRGVVILPHLTWDWIAKYTLDHRYNTHPENSYQVLRKDPMKALEYMKALIGQTLDRLEPFGYAMVGFEFKNMGLRAGILGMVREYYSWIIVGSGAEIMTPSQTVEWFTAKFDGTPEYGIRFRSPASGEEVEWLFNTHYRLARSGWFVNSFVDYAEQALDPYLNKGGFVNFYQKPTATNQIDTSLIFKIDALGQKIGHPRVRHEGVMYLGPLTLFPLVYGIHPIYVAALAGLCTTAILIAIRISRASGILSKKAAASLSAALLILAPTFQLGVILLQKPAPAQEVVKDDWQNVASIAWRYYQPGKGVEGSTGLHHAGLYWPYFTDWDLSNYIMAILEAEELGLISPSGDWGSDYRLSRLIDFLKTRPLTPDGVPYVWYDSRTGTNQGTTRANLYDSGKLLLVLNRLRMVKPQYSADIDWIVNVRTNYTAIAADERAWSSASGPYAYLAALGFASFGMGSYAPVSRALGALEALENASTVSVEGIELPQAYLTLEPLLHLIFEADYDRRVSNLLFKLYLVHELRFQREGLRLAFSEGNTGLNDPSYVYEWVVTGDGGQWVITAPGAGRYNITPISFFKVAIAFRAVYDSEYARNLTDWIYSLFSNFNEPNCRSFDCGFMEGADTSGRVVGEIIDRTNSLVLSAARYAMNGLLKIETSPPVPATLYVDGVARDPWGLDYLPLPRGSYMVRFGDVPYYVTPEDMQVQVLPGSTTTATGQYVPAGLLKVETNPPVPATIYLNGVPVAVWGLDYLPLPPGTYTIKFGDVPYYVTPSDQTVEVVQGQVSIVVGEYVKAGLLKVETNPPLPSVIYLNGTPVAVWGLDYLPVKPAAYIVSFGDVDDYDTPPSQTINVQSDETVVVRGDFTPNPGRRAQKCDDCGYLKIETNPPVPATLYVNGAPRDPWGLDYLPLQPGTYVIRFGDVGPPLTAYYVTPPDTSVHISSGEVKVVVGNYVRAGLLKIETSPPVPANLYVNGIRRDPWGVDYLPLPPGTYTIRFGDVPYYVTPPDQVVEVMEDGITVVIGEYLRAGLLKVETNPAVPATIYLDGVPVAVWGLDYLPLRPGNYLVYFGRVEGFNQPGYQLATVSEGNVAIVIGAYQPS